MWHLKRLQVYLIKWPLNECANKMRPQGLGLKPRPSPRLTTKWCRIPLPVIHWLPVAARIRFNILVLAYRAVNGSGPSYIQDLVKSFTPTRSLCSASTNRLATPSLRGRPGYTSTKTRLFAVLAPTVNGGMTSPSTSGQQKVYTSSIADWKHTFFDCTSANEISIHIVIMY